MKRNKLITNSIRCPVCDLHMTMFLSERESNNNAVCAYCEDITNFRDERWCTALREARSGARLIASDLNTRAAASRA